MISYVAENARGKIVALVKKEFFSFTIVFSYEICDFSLNNGISLNELGLISFSKKFSLKNQIHSLKKSNISPKNRDSCEESRFF